MDAGQRRRGHAQVPFGDVALRALRASLAEARAGERAAYVDVGIAVRSARRAGRSAASLADELGVDVSLLADCSRLVGAMPAEDAREALSALSLAHCLALAPVVDRRARKQIMERAVRDRLSVRRVRQAALGARLDEQRVVDREVRAIAAEVQLLGERLARLADGPQPASRAAVAMLQRLYLAPLRSLEILLDRAARARTS